jgi:hypothetical protein
LSDVKPTPPMIEREDLLRAMATPRGRLGVQRLATSLGVAVIGLTRQEIAWGIAGICERDRRIGEAQRNLTRMMLDERRVG